MNFLREWLLSVLSASLVLSLLHALMPKGSVRKAGELAIGLVLFLIIVRPLADITPNWLKESIFSQAVTTGAYPEELSTANERYLESVMCRRCEEYIIAQADSLGLAVSAQVECSWESGYPIPFQVVVFGSPSSDLTQIICTDLGVSMDCIVYRGAEE